MSLSVAFFRNLNLGQRRSHSPTRPQLLDAFTRAGATDPVNFQVDGTVVFAHDGDAQALGEESSVEVSFFDGPDPFPEPLLWDVEKTSGATWALERRLGMPVTSRGVPTMRRLQARLRTIAD